MNYRLIFLQRFPQTSKIDFSGYDALVRGRFENTTGFPAVCRAPAGAENQHFAIIHKSTTGCAYRAHEGGSRESPMNNFSRRQDEKGFGFNGPSLDIFAIFKDAQEIVEKLHTPTSTYRTSPRVWYPRASHHTKPKYHQALVNPESGIVWLLCDMITDVPSLEIDSRPLRTLA